MKKLYTTIVHPRNVTAFRMAYVISFLLEHPAEVKNEKTFKKEGFLQSDDAEDLLNRHQK